jgi:hypothetical protein
MAYALAYSIHTLEMSALRGWGGGVSRLCCRRDRQPGSGDLTGRARHGAAELTRLLAAANSIVDRDGQRPEFVVLKGALQGASRKTPASTRRVLGGTA